jgi:hypothetical protein
MQYITRLDEVEMSSGVLEWHSGGCTNYRSGRFVENEDLGRRVLCGAHGHEEPHGRRCIFWHRSGNGQIMQTEIEHKKFYGRRISGRKQELPHAIWARKFLQKQV